MKLNEDQHRIFNELNDFIFNLDNKNKFYLLTGLAGTGKTFLITYLLSLPALYSKKIAVTGCTNKAVGVLQSTFYKIQKHLSETNVISADVMDNRKYNLNFLTIHKLLQIKRKINANGEEIFESMIDENNIKIKSKSIFYYHLIIIDEVSMLNKDITLQLLRLQKKLKGKIIFLGDKAQLPPVRESESHIFELSTMNLPSGNLNKIMRSGDQLISFANSVRQLIDNPLHKVPFKKLANVAEGESRIGLYRKQEEWIEKYLKESSNTDQIILCYTNKRVDYLNRMIRNILYHTSTNNFVDGEKIIFNNTYSLPINLNKYDSSQMVRISSSSESTINIRQFNLYDILNIRFSVSLLDPNCSAELRKKCRIPELSVEAGRLEKSNIRMNENRCMVCYDDIGDFMIEYCKSGHHFCEKCFDTFKSKENHITECPICMFKFQEGSIIVMDDSKLTSMINQLRDITKDNNSKYKTWLIMLENNDLLNVIHHDDLEKYNNVLEKIKAQLRDINMYIQTRYPNNDNLLQKVLLQLWEFYYYYYIDQFADINYGNAITTHRSQGSTYQRVYVDLIDIITCNNVKKEAFQCLYTAVTRASDYLEILY
jgi:thymidine kinase